MGLDGIAAARLKGRLRAWDSQAVPAWGGVPAERCVQLGYFCLLACHAGEPGEVVPSREADLADIRPFRQFNRLRLASDADGLSTWNNLLADLRELILLARPRSSSCLIRISIRTRTMSAPRRPCARRSRGWTGSRRHCCTMPITCTTTIAGRWAMRTWGQPAAADRRMLAVAAMDAGAGAHAPGGQGHGLGHDARPATQAAVRAVCAAVCRAGSPGVAGRHTARTSSCARRCVGTSCSGWSRWTGRHDAWVERSARFEPPCCFGAAARMKV